MKKSKSNKMKDKADFEEENIYSEEQREELLEKDELTPEEVAFMLGYDEAG